MLLRTEDLDIDLINAFYAERAGHEALLVGNLAELAIGGAVEPLEPLTISPAELLLSTTSAAIMHYGEIELWDGDSDFAPRPYSVMMGANYHGGHSEGQHLIVIQNPDRPGDGQWMLHARPDSDNRTIRRRNMLVGKPYPFEAKPTNPEKVRHYFIHTGPADELFSSFVALGYTFNTNPTE